MELNPQPQHEEQCLSHLSHQGFVIHTTKGKYIPPSAPVSPNTAGDWWLPLLSYKQGNCQQTYLIVTILFYERYFICLPGVFLSHKACSFFHKVAIFISPSLLF